GQKILKNLNISKCIFYGESAVIFSQIAGKTTIHESEFNEKFLYHANVNWGTINFGSVVFNNDVSFGQNKYTDGFSFNTVEINGKSRLHSNTYNSNFHFTAVQLNNKSVFKNEKYENAYFQDIEFSLMSHLFEEISLSNDSSLTFRNIFFPKNVSLHICDTYKMIFIDSDISDVKFSSCNWNSPNRLIIFDEIKRKSSIIELKKLEDIYRQFKKNFENYKDWELSGKAYISELTIRKYRLWKERSYISWFIYSFYDLFGGFTQNYIKPLKWFLFLTLFLFPLYYLLFENFDVFSLYPLEYQDCSVTNAFIKSLSASFPLIKTNLYYNNWWMQAIQILISTILITFFILGLRKRFKQ
ncbi:MAG: hypothetical protein KBT58_05055, partial [Bizionia sp.]|nr:hypothetical protein [Bizionia sp.]